MANPFDAIQYSFLNSHYNWILRQNNYISAGIAEYLANPASLALEKAEKTAKDFMYNYQALHMAIKTKMDAELSSRIAAQESMASEYKGSSFFSKAYSATDGKIFDKSNHPDATLGIGVDSGVVEYTARSNNRIADRISTNYLTKFTRTPVLDPFSANTTTKEFIFITKPDLNLFKSAGKVNDQLINHSAFFADNLIRYREIAEQLQYSIGGPKKGPFIPLLSNAFSGHADLPGISADTFETANNVYGYHINYRASSYTSDYEPEVSLEFRDTKYLEVYMLLKMYDEYERLKWRGLVDPPNVQYIYRKILHDQVSMYKIITDADGMTIRYWARWTGGTLTSVPRDTFSDLADGEITLSTSWKFHWVEDMNPNILIDINRLTRAQRSSGSNQTVPLFDKNSGMPSADWPSAPMIQVANHGNNSNKRSRYDKYFLTWVS